MTKKERRRGEDGSEPKLGNSTCGAEATSDCCEHEGTVPERPRCAGMTDTATKLDPAAKYGAPEKIIEDSELDPKAKRMLLRQWQKDLTQLLTATDENMPAMQSEAVHPKRDDDNASLLQRVSNCLLRVQEKHRTPGKG